MKFCPECGKPLANPTAKFCSECGASLQPSTETPPAKPPSQPTAQPAPQPATYAQAVGPQPSTTAPIERSDEGEEEFAPVKLKAYNLGVQLEQTTASILERMGYKTEMRAKPPTKSGAVAEIDILVSRGNRRRAVECKNYDPSKAVGTTEMRKFRDDLKDIGIPSGLFVTSSVFSKDAEKLADSDGIELWDMEELRQKLFEYSIGRLRNPSQLTDPVLPLKLDFASASTLPIKNPDAVKLFSSVLLYQPYILVKYRMLSVRHDPTGRTHKITDQGTTVIDMLDGDIVNRERSVIEGIAGFFKSREERAESKEDKLVVEELTTVSPMTEPVLRTSDYNLSIAEPSITEEDAINLTRQYVKEKNEQDVEYDIRVRGETETRSLRIVPRLNEIEIRGQHLVYVPKWDLQYEAGQTSYVRRYFASSGRAIEDSLAKCSKCTLLKRPTIAVCEECGETICDKHAYQENGRWVCPDHSAEASTQQSKLSGLTSRFRGFGLGKQPSN